MSINRSNVVMVPKMSTRHQQQQPTPTYATNTSVNIMPLSSPPLPSKNTEPKNSQDNVRREYFDVYAKPFVPQILRAINRDAAAQVIATEPMQRIDFSKYIATFVGQEFILERIVGDILTNGRELHAHQIPFTPESYNKYFDMAWRAEKLAKEEEHAGYEMYKVRLSRVPNAIYGDPLYTLVVPGLREDSPFIEMGDTIQLREIYFDGHGNVGTLVGSKNRFNSPVFHTWSGTQHDASVVAVNRAEEKVFLKISGLLPMTEIFNVVLPLKQRRIQEQWKTLCFVHQELQKAYGIDNDPYDKPQVPHTPNINSTVENQDQKDQKSNQWIRRMLFPEAADGIVQTNLRSIPRRKLFDSQTNYEQLQAVDSSCNVEFGVLPFLISGPPGTGKTKTLVEIALQLLKDEKVKHILICAPSDQAADTLALRLRFYFKTEKLLRLNGPQRADNEVPNALLPYCYRERDMFYIPPFRQLMAYNIVVTTTRDATILVDARLTNIDLYYTERNIQSSFNPENPKPPTTLHWGALLVDEAAQATEMDTLSAICIAMPPSSYPEDLEQPRFFMAGDENQLGPRTVSRCKEYSTSLFARLTARHLYSTHPLSRSSAKPSSDPIVMKESMLPMLYAPFVNLTRNYRSHPAILSVPSSLFYNDTLLPEAELEVNTGLQNSSLWEGKKWPVLYIPHTGADEVEQDGGGWYNVNEARIACDLAQRLVVESRVAQRDIVIMSPFAAQVRLLRRIIRSSVYGGGPGLWEVNIGPLEAFQGLESRVVIICTTRTRERFLDMDKEKGLGLFGFRRKMNVAITRAKMGLFVIANSRVLVQDEYWRAFLAFCWRNGLYQGKPFTEDMVKSFQSCKIGVLEKALLAKAERQSSALGPEAAPSDIIGEDDYDAWINGVHEAFDKDYSYLTS